MVMPKEIRFHPKAFRSRPAHLLDHSERKVLRLRIPARELLFELMVVKSGGTFSAERRAPGTKPPTLALPRSWGEGWKREPRAEGDALSPASSFATHVSERRCRRYEARRRDGVRAGITTERQAIVVERESAATLGP